VPLTAPDSGPPPFTPLASLKLSCGTGALRTGVYTPSASVPTISSASFTFLYHRSKAIDAMAEPIGIASGLVALATFAFKSSITLHNTIKSFKVHPIRVRNLLEQLEALSGVLQSLTETVTAAVDVDLSELELPLLRCGTACKEFGEELVKCSSRSGGTRASFRDWARLQYMGGDMDNFMQMLAGYKSTIIIALFDASL
jgi:hypothetical protein